MAVSSILFLLPFSDCLVELGQFQRGQQVLDVASGYSEPAITAAQRVSPNARVAVTDISLMMLEFARKRVNKQLNSNRLEPLICLLGSLFSLHA